MEIIKFVIVHIISMSGQLFTSYEITFKKKHISPLFHIDSRFKLMEKLFFRKKPVWNVLFVVSTRGHYHKCPLEVARS